MPEPRTATVRPPAWSAPRWAAASIPCAAPETTASPADTTARPRSSATERPISEHFREPTIATRSGRSIVDRPRRNRPTGGSERSRSRLSYSGSAGVTNRAPASVRRAAVASGSIRRSQSRSPSLPSLPERTDSRHPAAVPRSHASAWRESGRTPRSPESARIRATLDIARSEPGWPPARRRTLRIRRHAPAPPSRTRCGTTTPPPDAASRSARTRPGRRPFDRP